MTIQDGLVDQTEQCFRNIPSALTQAGASLRDVVRVVYVLPKAIEFPDCWPVLRKYFGDVRPAAMMISAGLADPRMRIEIEVTARRVRHDFAHRYFERRNFRLCLIPNKMPIPIAPKTTLDGSGTG